jgi:hypothetical protein
MFLIVYDVYELSYSPEIEGSVHGNVDRIYRSACPATGGGACEGVDPNAAPALRRQAADL